MMHDFIVTIFSVFLFMFACSWLIHLFTSFMLDSSDSKCEQVEVVNIADFTRK